MKTLRQENSELRHRLKQLESRASTQQGGSGSTSTLDVVALNAKYKKQIESLRKELEEFSGVHEKLRVDSARELAKTRHQLSLAIGCVSMCEHVCMCEYVCITVYVCVCL